MSVITIPKKEVTNIIGNIKDEELDYKLNIAELGVEQITNEVIDIEITPNRPDLLSLQGVKRYLNNYFKKSKPKQYKPKKPQKNYQVTIDSSVKEVRPHTACAIVKNLKLNEEKIKDLIEIQEKLHSSYGRNRKKIAIGIYPLEQIKLPITFKALPPNQIKFQPLDYPKEITGKQILSKHPAGREYGNLLKNYEKFPIFVDANNQILSMPPIINSNKTGKINKKTKEVFIECSGFNLPYLKNTLNIIVTTLADMGGEIYSMKIKDKSKRVSPDLEYKEFPINIDNINKLLGLELKESQIKTLLQKMGILYKNKKALIPPYRTDILHEADISEDIAIAYGYDNILPKLPNISTIGYELPIETLKNKITQILIGLGFQETSTYHLSTKEKQFKKINNQYKDADIIKTKESKNENNILRISLLAQSIQTLSQNSDAEYPQKIFELGKIFYSDENSETQISEKENLCISICHEKTNFTELKQVLDYLMRMLDKQYEIKETENPSFIDGRTGAIHINNKPIGIIGEVKPIVLKNNKIKMPAVSLEISLDNF